MSEAKHTPGPWATDEDDHDAPYQNINIEAGKHHTICTVWIDDAPVRDFNADDAEYAAGHGSRIYVRAKTRDEAKATIQQDYPTATFRK